MTNPIDRASDVPRSQWLAVLARATRAELEACVADLGPLPERETVRPAEVGMVMLRGRVGGTGDAFNLGEASLVRCAIRLGTALGVGYSMGRDKAKAELIAVLDALLQDENRRSRLLLEVVTPLRQRQQARRDAQSCAAATSKVDFFTMVRGEA